MKRYTICFMSTGGITVDAENEEDALDRFENGEFDEDVYMSLAANDVSFTEIYEEED